MKKASIILVDWSVRHSLHPVRFLNRQTISRGDYEIIWVEFYKQRTGLIEEYVRERKVDKWIIMDMNSEQPFHKHKMYNEGLLASEGEIIVIPDSDVIFSPTFLQSIITTFDKYKYEDIVLHLDELHVENRLFPYPFGDLPYENIILILNAGIWVIGNLPFPEVVERLKGGPVEPQDKSSLPHGNIGACACVRKIDAIKAGGFDEAEIYAGTLCSGPHEMSWRLLNKGHKLLWHPTEWLIHLWHPRPMDTAEINHNERPDVILEKGITKVEVENLKIKQLRRKLTKKYRQSEKHDK